VGTRKIGIELENEVLGTREHIGGKKKRSGEKSPIVVSRKRDREGVGRAADRLQNHNYLEVLDEKTAVLRNSI